MTDVEYGPTERAYRKWVAGLGVLSERQSAEAEQVYTLARLLDTTRVESASAAAALSRELRQLSAGLRDVIAPAAPVEQATPAGVADEVARRRAARRNEAV